MKFLVRAFAIMVAVNVGAFLWMGLSLGDWNPAHLDSAVKTTVEQMVAQGPLFWVAYFLVLIVAETLVLFLALLLSVAFEGAFWSTLAVTLAILGLVSLKAWDIQKSVKKAGKQVERAVDMVDEPMKDAWKKAHKTFK